MASRVALRLAGHPKGYPPDKTSVLVRVVKDGMLDPRSNGVLTPHAYTAEGKVEIEFPGPGTYEMLVRRKPVPVQFAEQYNSIVELPLTP